MDGSRPRKQRDCPGVTGRNSKPTVGQSFVRVGVNGQLVDPGPAYSGQMPTAIRVYFPHLVARLGRGAVFAFGHLGFTAAQHR